MYSAQLLKSAVYGVKKALGKGHCKLTAALNKVNSEMIELRRRCEEADEHRLVIPEGLPELNKLLSRLSAACEDWLEEHRDGELHAEVLALYFEVHFYLRIAELYDTNYTTLLAAFGSEVCVRLLCLDAAPFLDASWRLAAPAFCSAPRYHRRNTLFKRWAAARPPKRYACKAHFLRKGCASPLPGSAQNIQTVSAHGNPCAVSSARP